MSINLIIIIHITIYWISVISYCTIYITQLHLDFTLTMYHLSVNHIEETFFYLYIKAILYIQNINNSLSMVMKNLFYNHFVQLLCAWFLMFLSCICIFYSDIIFAFLSLKGCSINSRIATNPTNFISGLYSKLSRHLRGFNSVTMPASLLH